MLIDSHCHLIDKRYKTSVQDIIDDAKSWGVEKFITIGTSIKESKKAVELANSYAEVYATVGIYPHEEKEQEISSLRTGLECLVSKKTVAIGECGIDLSNWKEGRELNKQIELFEMQIELSIKHNIPISIHNRNGDENILASLKKFPNARGVIHCFSSNWAFAKSVLDLGYLISFSGTITYKTSENLCEVVKKTPVDCFLLETDSPYLPPEGQRGQVNTPRNVKIIALRVSELKNIPFEEVCQYSTANTLRVFNL